MSQQGSATPSVWPVSRLEPIELWLDRHWASVGIGIVAAGLALRLYFAHLWYLNPDEALDYFVAAQDQHTWLFWYRTAFHDPVHPPLFLWLLHVVVEFNRSQPAVRAISITAGALFPWFVMLWVRRFAGTAAGVCTLLILTFSPALIGLSTEVRDYSVAFLAVSISMCLLEKGLEDYSVRSLVWFHFFLYIAILSDYSIVWYVLAAGIYALVRLAKRRAPRAVWITWGSGQTLALGLYMFLYFTQVSRGIGKFETNPVDTFLRGAFLQPGENIALFAVRHTLGQFRFLFGNVPVAVAAAALFLWGVFMIQRRDSWRAVFIILPFVAACLGAVFHLLPYHGARHSAFLTIFSATAIGIALAALFRNRVLVILITALALVPPWEIGASDTLMTIPDRRHRLSQMQDAIQFLRTSVPSGSLVVTDQGTDLMLNFYMPSRDYSEADNPYRIRQLDGLQLVVMQTFRFADDRELQAALARVCHDFPGKEAVWVAAGGFGISVQNPAASDASFQQAIAIFRSSCLPGR
jgi:dolichyl-phosphate-mannose-protein mannosyltransferase